MYFSKHNEKITFINHYSGLLEVKGEDAICREDTELWPKPTESIAREYHTLSITDGITEVGEGFLDAFPYIGCLILGRTVESVAISPEMIKRMCKKKGAHPRRIRYICRTLRKGKQARFSSQRHSSGRRQYRGRSRTRYHNVAVS